MARNFWIVRTKFGEIVCPPNNILTGALNSKISERPPRGVLTKGPNDTRTYVIQPITSPTNSKLVCEKEDHGEQKNNKP